MLLQWGIHTIYQEDYRNITDAGETGMRITYSPSDIGFLINEFRSNLKDAYSTVRMINGDYFYLAFVHVQEVLSLNVNSTLMAQIQSYLTLDEV